MNDEVYVEKLTTELQYQRKMNKVEMRHQLVSFSLMLFFTLLAFLSVSLDFSKYFIVPFIFLLAIVQVAFQLYYFMHMKHKGHSQIQLFLYSGMFVGMMILLAFYTIVWW